MKPARTPPQRSPAVNNGYRNIHTLVDDAILVWVEVPGEAGRYEAGKLHHHPFQCDRCPKVFEIDDCFVTDWPALPEDFRSTAIKSSSMARAPGVSSSTAPASSQ